MKRKVTSNHNKACSLKKRRPRVAFFLQERLFFEGELWSAVSVDPFLSFSFKNGKKGDKVFTTWFYNKNDSRTDETKIR